MEKDLRASLIAAGAAAALSALVGIMAGVAFFALLLRAIVGGILIGGAVYGGLFLLQRTVPGLFAQQEGEEVEFTGGPGERGANVDIVLPGDGESPEAFARGEAARPGIEDSASGTGPRDRGSRKAGRDYGAIKRAVGVDEAAEFADAEDTSLLEPDSPGYEAAAALPPTLGGSPVPDKDHRPSVGFDDLDVLPDLEGFSDSFTATEFGSGGSSSVEKSPTKEYAGAPGSATRAGPNGADPAALAQAVRTILKRDQKG